MFPIDYVALRRRKQLDYFRVVMAEFFASYAVVTITLMAICGSGTVEFNGLSTARILYVSLASACAVTFSMYSFALYPHSDDPDSLEKRHSTAGVRHVNPLISLCLYMMRRISLLALVLSWAAQFGAGFLAFLTIRLMVGSNVVLVSVDRVSDPQAFFLILLTNFLSLLVILLSNFVSLSSRSRVARWKYEYDANHNKFFESDSASISLYEAHQALQNQWLARLHTRAPLDVETEQERLAADVMTAAEDKPIPKIYVPDFMATPLGYLAAPEPSLLQNNCMVSGVVIFFCMTISFASCRELLNPVLALCLHNLVDDGHTQGFSVDNMLLVDGNTQISSQFQASQTLTPLSDPHPLPLW